MEESLDRRLIEADCASVIVDVRDNFAADNVVNPRWILQPWIGAAAIRRPASMAVPRVRIMNRGVNQEEIDLRFPASKFLWCDPRGKVLTRDANSLDAAEIADGFEYEFVAVRIRVCRRRRVNSAARE